MGLKLAFHPRSKKIIVCGGASHAGDIPVKLFDAYIRAVYFERFKTIYFRFYAPSGEYVFPSDKDFEESFRACESALDAFIEEGIISKKTKVLFWQTNKQVTESLIRY